MSLWLARSLECSLRVMVKQLLVTAGHGRSRTRARGSRGLAVRFDIQKYSFLRSDGHIHGDGFVDQWPEHVVHFFSHGIDAKMLALSSIPARMQQEPQLILGESWKRFEYQPSSRNRLGALEPIRLVMERCGAYRRDPEGAQLRPVQVRDGALFGTGRASVQRLRFVPPALLRGDLRLRCEPFAVLVVLDPGHDDASLRGCRQPLRPTTRSDAP